MAITIMGGLAFATILTLVAAPLLYSLLLGSQATPVRLRLPVGPAQLGGADGAR